ncbi:hypothetical protein [Shewanella sp. Isolate11]|uniref:hypothetical protein n=1 Tax=Shewanella sp. Isolate11 TaxID=2908530 RepID=UPI001EFD26E3|nr:hypothetical protein [Shewanella sp. Isolate11]MCG9698196.1 hypothetical protein [Shewanella sp. Isolate11]
MQLDVHEFKQMVVSELEMGNPLPSEVANQYGISSHKVYSWMRERRQTKPQEHSLQTEITQIQRHQQRLC